MTLPTNPRSLIRECRDVGLLRFSFSSAWHRWYTERRHARQIKQRASPMSRICLERLELVSGFAYSDKFIADAPPRSLSAS